MNFYTTPPYYEKTKEKLKELSEQYSFVNKYTAGKSVCGRNIDYIRIGAGKNAILFAGGFHAQEWQTVMVLLKYAEELCSKADSSSEYGKKLLKRLDERALIILPVANPDGTEIALLGAKTAGEYAPFIESIGADNSFNANAHGVDINHNFDAGWSILKKMETDSGITAPRGKQYGGEAANSEPETQAMVRLLKENYIENLYAFHSQGEVIYYEYGNNTPPQSEYIVKLLCDVSGYEPIKNDGLCSHGGFKDYFINEYGRPGFTVEIGYGENPLPIADFPGIYKKLKELLHVATVI